MTLTLAAGRMELSLETKRLLWTAAIVFGASLPHWPSLSPWVPIMLLAAIAWRFGVAFYGWPAPVRAVRMPLALGVFLTVLFEYRTLNGVVAGSALLGVTSWYFS
jgi:hypothetical protein